MRGAGALPSQKSCQAWGCATRFNLYITVEPRPSIDIETNWIGSLANFELIEWLLLIPEVCVSIRRKMNRRKWASTRRILLTWFHRWSVIKAGLDKVFSGVDLDVAEYMRIVRIPRLPLFFLLQASQELATLSYFSSSVHETFKLFEQLMLSQTIYGPLVFLLLPYLNF